MDGERDAREDRDGAEDADTALEADSDDGNKDKDVEGMVEESGAEAVEGDMAAGDIEEAVGGEWRGRGDSGDGGESCGDVGTAGVGAAAVGSDIITQAGEEGGTSDGVGSDGSDRSVGVVVGEGMGAALAEGGEVAEVAE